ncbi:MAG: pyruvate kinase [Lachnospiraceae bacterium]|nr:pyruvate kinase [Lachnospiraceae bacterium]
MKKTKVICTVGPGTDDEKLLEELILGGMDIARFNFSHGSYEEHKKRMDMVKRIRDKHSTHTAIMLDTKGPEIRTGLLKGHKPVELKAGKKISITTEQIEGTADRICVSYHGFVDELYKGSRILIDDGLIELSVIEKKQDELVCTIINGGLLNERKGVNVPSDALNLPTLTEQDKADLAFGVEQDIDFIAASFVRDAAAVLEIKAYLKSLGAPFIPIIAKIENPEGIRNIDEIIRASDGIMVARGDLGVEIPPEQVPYMQKMIIQKCAENFKPVITATQMLDSMIRNPRPTRAEVTDVANAVYDGTDAVMLSGETAAGKYPREALKMMVHIIESTESHLDYDTILEKSQDRQNKGVSSAIGYASVLAAHNLNTKCIITPSISGATARVVSKLRPKQVILGISPNVRALRRMSLYWGVDQIESLQFSTTEDLCNGAVELAHVKNYVESGDTVVLTAGIPSPNILNEKTNISNMMQIVTV